MSPPIVMAALLGPYQRRNFLDHLKKPCQDPEGIQWYSTSRGVHTDMSGNGFFFPHTVRSI